MSDEEVGDGAGGGGEGASEVENDGVGGVGAAVRAVMQIDGLVIEVIDAFKGRRPASGGDDDAFEVGRRQESSQQVHP